MRGLTEEMGVGTDVNEPTIPAQDCAHESGCQSASRASCNGKGQLNGYNGKGQADDSCAPWDCSGSGRAVAGSGKAVAGSPLGQHVGYFWT